MHGPIFRLIGEPVKPCTPYQDNHHQQMVVTGLEVLLGGWLHCEGVVLIFKTNIFYCDGEICIIINQKFLFEKKLCACIFVLWCVLLPTVKRIIYQFTIPLKCNVIL